MGTVFSGHALRNRCLATSGGLWLQIRWDTDGASMPAISVSMVLDTVGRLPVQQRMSGKSPVEVQF